MFDVRERPEVVERALLLGVYQEKSEEAAAQELLVELEDLVKTLGISVVEKIAVRVQKLHAGYLTGTGKAAELIAHAKERQCDVIIFDNELSPAQQRSWEKDGNIAVIDRQEVILDIFNIRAKTREARLQVDLARMRYSLPRLKRMWSHLDRQGGGGGGGSTASRGEGETQLEVDRRLARTKITRLKEELAAVRQVRTTQRKERERDSLPHAAIVGYTNAGKSTLLNALTGSSVLSEDKLFATLDTTTRRFELPDGQAALLTDTVGFVRRLPHTLVESFKATLEEALLADFLIHVVDASHPEMLQFYNTTTEVLKELGAGEKRMMVVLNKIDLITDQTWLMHLHTHFPTALFVSVRTGQNLDLLRTRLCEWLDDRVARLTLRIPMAEAGLVSLIHREGKVLAQAYEGNDTLVQGTVPKKWLAKFSPYLYTGEWPTEE
jgi:GTPase